MAVLLIMPEIQSGYVAFVSKRTHDKITTLKNPDFGFYRYENNMGSKRQSKPMGSVRTVARGSSHINYSLCMYLQYRVFTKN